LTTNQAITGSNPVEVTRIQKSFYEKWEDFFHSEHLTINKIGIEAAQ